MPSVVVASGYVKLNGVAVRQSSWPQHRGLNILLIDPFTCSVQEARHFDTYISAAAAVNCSRYLQQVSNGRVIVGVTNDESTLNLAYALSTLQEIGVNVRDVQLRGTFVFIAQKGYPAKTVIRKVLTHEEAQLHPAQVTATITGI